MTDSSRFVVLGTGGHFTFQVLTALLEQGVKPQAYIQWAEKDQATSSSAFGIPVEVKQKPLTLSNLLAEHQVAFALKASNLADQLSQYAVEFLLVACWPALLSPQVIRQVSSAALNLHPSLLPKYRGVDPIGEQIKHNETVFGVSLHLLSDEYDCGDIVQQSIVAVNSNTNRKMIETACAKKGAELFLEALQHYLKPGWRLHPQNG